jgi:hypothetical protein
MWFQQSIFLKVILGKIFAFYLSTKPFCLLAKLLPFRKTFIFWQDFYFIMVQFLALIKTFVSF